MGVPDWDAIKKEYIAGGTSLRKLADKYEISFTTLSRKCQKEKWVSARQRTDDKATTIIVNKTARAQANVRNRIYNIANKALDRIEAVVSTVDEEKIRNVTGALLDVKKVLDAKDPTDLKEQKARIKKLQREAMEQKDVAKEIVVRVEGGDPTWET